MSLTIFNNSKSDQILSDNNLEKTIEQIIASSERYPERFILFLKHLSKNHSNHSVMLSEIMIETIEKKIQRNPDKSGKIIRKVVENLFQSSETN